MRNFNKEIEDNSGRSYFYGFDYDVMHHFMIKALSDHFQKGNLLEMGSFQGAFTKRLLDLKIFDSISCVEASSDAVANVDKKIEALVDISNTTFEEFEATSKYNNIVMTHVLEHLDNPVMVLKKINDELMADEGILGLICPNANAPSRQIAVKMGLISHNSAVTPAEVEHGHRITYTLDTLERDARAAGLDVIARKGIFFKALANFQWDLILKQDGIISPEYLEGCYQLGQIYPDLCSSIMLVCKKGQK